MYHFAYLDCIGQMSRMQVSSAGVDLSQFLEFPTHSRSDFAYSSGDPNEENNGGGDDMEE